MPFGLTYRSLCGKNHRSISFLIIRAPFGIAAQAHSALHRIITDAAQFCNTKKSPKRDFLVDGFFSSRGNTGLPIQTDGCHCCLGRFCTDPCRCVRSSHLAENPAVRRGDAFDGKDGAVRIESQIGGRNAGKHLAFSDRIGYDRLDRCFARTARSMISI